MLLSTATHARDDYPRSAAVDALHYRIHLRIKSAGDVINAKTEILFQLSNDRVKVVALDFAGFVVEQVTENGRAARLRRAGDRINIALRGNYKRGDRCLIAIKYHGRTRRGLYIKRNKFGSRTVFADNWPNGAHYWFPAIDHPYDKATVEFFVTAPDRYDVVANGALIETRSLQNGTRLTHWSESVPIPTYCMVIGAAEFSIINSGSQSGIPLLYYLYPKDRNNGLRDYGRAMQMVEFYTNLIGPYPYEKLALVQSSTRFGGMENASNIFFDEDAFTGSGQMEDTVAHEIAHQWFGDSVTEGDWHHLWLSEGFAQYFGHLFFEHAEGRDRLVSLMLADKASYLNEQGANLRPIYDPSIGDLSKLLNQNNYAKGSWVLHMLRRLMGDERFFAGIRDYYQTYRDRNALTSDFQQVMQSHAGQGLDWFFKEWIYEPHYPTYDVVWRWDETAKELRVRITQKQEGATFRMPLDVEIKTNGTAQREVIEVSEREQTFTFKLASKPSGVAIDPDEWVLKVVKLSEER